MRKKTFRLAAALLAFCITASLFPPVGLAAENEGYFDLTGAINQADSGGTVTLPSDAMIISSDGEAPWIIPKNITIDGQGHKIILRAGGVLLGGDVTIQDAQLDHQHPQRGHCQRVRSDAGQRNSRGLSL